MKSVACTVSIIGHYMKCTVEFGHTKMLLCPIMLTSTDTQASPLEILVSIETGV